MRLRLGPARKTKGAAKTAPKLAVIYTGGTGADVPGSVAEVVTSFTHKPTIDPGLFSSVSRQKRMARDRITGRDECQTAAVSPVVGSRMRSFASRRRARVVRFYA
jgi:hypothetical protein